VKTISLAVIVRNEASNLEPCLSPVRDLVSKIVIADTGSTDDTIAVARRLSTRVLHFPWADSFAAARNAAIENATGDWIFILDADDRILKSQRVLLTQDAAEQRGIHMGLHIPDPGVREPRCPQLQGACPPTSNMALHRPLAVAGDPVRTSTTHLSTSARLTCASLGTVFTSTSVMCPLWEVQTRCTFAAGVHFSSSLTRACIASSASVIVVSCESSHPTNR